MDWAKTTARGHEKHLIWGFGAIYTRGFTVDGNIHYWCCVVYCFFPRSRQDMVMWKERQMQVLKEEKRIRESMTELVEQVKGSGEKRRQSSMRKPLKPVSYLVKSYNHYMYHFLMEHVTLVVITGTIITATCFLKAGSHRFHPRIPLIVPWFHVTWQG